MTYEQIATFAVLAGALTLFVTEKLPVDVTALLVPLALGLLGVLKPAEALAGFGNPAVVTVGAMFVLSAALVESGAVSALGALLQRISGKTERRALLALCVVVAGCSAFMNNTPVVVVFLPMVLAVASEVGAAPSKLLIPLSYATILGGCCTLIGTSTTVLVSSELQRRNLEPIGFFEPAGVGLVMLAVGAIYMIALAPKWLPVRRGAAAFSSKERITEYVTEVSVFSGSPIAGKTLRQAFTDPHPELTVIEVVRGQEILWPGDKSLCLADGDLVLVRGHAQAVAKVGEAHRAEILPELAGRGVRGRDVTLCELVVTAGSPLVGRTVRESTVRALHGATVMAVERRGSHLRSGIADLVLMAGDTLLVQSEKAKLEQFRGGEDFILLEGLHENLVLRRRAPWVLLVTLAVVALASLEVVDVSFLAVAAAVVLVATGCISMRRAYRSLDLSTLVLMGSTIAIGVALEKSGAAKLVAERLVDGVHWIGAGSQQAYAALAACYLICNVLTAFASNSAAALLVLPIGLGLATELHTSERPFIMAIVYAASLDFSTPTGYQTNLLVYGPGGYRFFDYVKFGGPLNLLLWGVAVFMIPVFFPF
ncbi:MAG: SLC13 family permease [Planctomycetes bacterium]|nr:SLC13 family permease [Planctomycetota bacterium]